MVKKYIKTTPVGAVQVTPDNHEEVKAFAYPQEITFGYELIMHSIDTLEGKMCFSDGDYLIKNQTVNAMCVLKIFLRKHMKR